MVSSDSYCPPWATRQQLVRGSVRVPEQILGAKEKSRLDVKRLITLHDGATCSDLSIRQISAVSFFKIGIRLM